MNAGACVGITQPLVWQLGIDMLDMTSSDIVPSCRCRNRFNASTLNGSVHVTDSPKSIRLVASDQARAGMVR